MLTCEMYPAFPILHAVKEGECLLYGYKIILGGTVCLEAVLCSQN